MEFRKKEDILNALACLKDMCRSYDTCSNCPAFNGVCKIKYSNPENYNLNITTDEIWRAFK